MTADRFDPPAHVGETVTVRGIARNAAAGAIVTVEDGPPIYIGGLDRWSKDVEGKAVDVTGSVHLRERQTPTRGPSDPPAHGLDHETFVLIDAQWALVE